VLNNVSDIGFKVLHFDYAWSVVIYLTGAVCTHHYIIFTSTLLKNQLDRLT